MEFDRVLITGGTGFIGRHLAGALEPRSKEVFVASRPGRGQGPGDAQKVSVDLRVAGAGRDLLRELRPTTVFHLAGRRPNHTDEEASETIDLNVRAAVEMVQACGALGVQRVVLVGSAEEYGDQAMPVREDAPLKPRSIYGASKASMTLHALALHRATQAPVVVVRPFSVYGPGAPARMFVAQATDCAARGVPFEMSDGLQRRDLVYVTDVVAGLILAATVAPAVGRVFNLGSGRSHTMREVATTLWRISGTGAELRIGARAKGPDDLLETLAETSAARDVLGWQARTGLEEGLRATWRAALGR